MVIRVRSPLVQRLWRIKVRRLGKIKTPLAIFILAGAATGMVIALVTAVSMPAVHAEGDASRPAAIEAVQGSLTNGMPGLPTGGLEYKAKVDSSAKKKLGVFHGLASWYGGVFDGRKTASGEKFDMHDLTACHPTLPFGSLVRVINRRNKRSVVVRINDRGDLTDDKRVIDLSWAAAEKLAMTKAGLARVDVEILSLGTSSGTR